MDSSEVKVQGGCYRNGKLRRVVIATNNPEIMAEWEKLSGQPIFNGWRRKIWRKRVVVGHIRFDEFCAGSDRVVSPKFPCLEICLFAGVLVRELFGIKAEELQFLDNNCCSSCKTGIRAKKEKK